MGSDLDPIIKECLKGGRMSIPEMIAKLWPNLPSWDRPTKISRLSRRCNKLVKDGEMRKFEENGVLYWELVA